MMYGGVYVKEMIIGRGCSATVFLAKAKETQTEEDEYFQSFVPSIMAVKSTTLSTADDLLQEQEIFSKLNGCPNILQFYGESLNIENTEEIYNLWLEFAPWGCLSDRIKKQRRSGKCRGIPEIEARHYTQSILLGLKHVHECGYVHCDLKPQNILICEDDVAKIADFGLSVKTHQEKEKFSVRGSPLYIAPEAIFGESYETISDVWGLGCVVLEMLSGKPPWKFPPKTPVCDALTFIACREELPVVPENLSFLALDFLKKCLVRDTRLRWSPDQLLRHPFVNFVEEVEKRCLVQRISAGMVKMWETMNSHHRDQLKIVENIRSLDISQAPPETSEEHHGRTVQLWNVVEDWHSQFRNLVMYQKDCIKALNSWLKLNLVPIESSLKEKVSSPPRVHRPPIHALLQAWNDTHEKLPDDLARSAISSFAHIIKNIMLHQEDEVKLKIKWMDTKKELERKTRGFQDWYHKHMQRKTPTDEVDPENDANDRDPVAVRRLVIETLEKRLEEEAEAHQKHCRQVREKSLVSLKTHLPELFRAMSDFSSASALMYKKLQSIAQSQNPTGSSS